MAEPMKAYPACCEEFKLLNTGTFSRHSWVFGNEGFDHLIIYGGGKMKLTCMLGLPLLLLLVTPAFADSVDLGVGGHLYGEYGVGVGGELFEGFTLNQATYITSFYIGIDPSFPGPGGGDWLLSLTGPGGVSWSAPNSTSISSMLPDVLPAGHYEITLTGLSCDQFCAGPAPAAWDYYSPATSFETGGTVSMFPGGGAGLGWELTGETVPEPGTMTLLGTGLLGLIAVARRKSGFKRNGAGHPSTGE